jgi:hypothetical protein
MMLRVNAYWHGIHAWGLDRVTRVIEELSESKRGGLGHCE